MPDDPMAVLILVVLSGLALIGGGTAWVRMTAPKRRGQPPEAEPPREPDTSIVDAEIDAADREAVAAESEIRDAVSGGVPRLADYANRREDS